MAGGSDSVGKAVPSIRFCCEPKTALKNKVYKKIDLKNLSHIRIFPLKNGDKIHPFKT